MIRRYTDKDYDMIARWSISRERNPPKKASLSPRGYICDDRVAGWIYSTDSNVALIEGIMSDPLTVPTLRRASMKRLCIHLIETAQAMGFTHITGITNHPSISRLCQQLGFKGQRFIVWTLIEE